MRTSPSFGSGIGKSFKVCVVSCTQTPFIVVFDILSDFLIDVGSEKKIIVSVVGSGRGLPFMVSFFFRVEGDLREVVAE